MKISQGVLTATRQAMLLGEPGSEIVERLSEIIMTGQMNDQQLDVYSSWMCRHSGEAGRHDYELLGGATGQRWLDGLMVKAAALETPEVEEDPVIEDVISGALDYLNLKEQAAFKRLWTALEMTAKNALRRTVAKATGTVRNEEVKARMASAGRPLDEIPPNLWKSAKLDTAATHIINSSVDDAIEEARSILTEEAELLPRMVEVIGLPVRSELLGDQERSVSNAIEYLEGALPDAISHWVRPRDGEPEFVLSPAVVRHAMLLAGGADPGTPIEDGFPARKGRPVAAGFGMLNGPLLFEQLRGFPATRAASLFPDDQLKIAYKWRHAYYRDPETPFQPHKRLNGRVFRLENWEKLQSRKKDPDDFPATDPVTGEVLDNYRIGDHDHCTCAAIPRFESQGGRVYGPAWFDSRLAHEETKAAAFNSQQPRCPVGTGRTAGRFSNEMLVNCNPMVTQLNDRSLAGRVRSLRDDLEQPGLSARRRMRLQEELELARDEIRRRQAGGKSDDESNPEGVADDPAENTQGVAEYADVEVDELNELAEFQGGGFTVREGHDSPTEGYGVADPAHTLGISDWSSLDDATQDAVIEQYLNSKEANFIEDSNVYLGAWVDENDVMFLDLTKVVSAREEAIALGIERNEKAIFGFDGFETISTGGTGNEQRITTAEAFLPASPGRDGGGNGETDSQGTEQQVGSPFDVAAVSTVPPGWTPEDPHPDRNIEQTIKGLATGVHDQALLRAENLTSHLQGIADHAAGELHGLEFSVKGIGSLTRKLRDKAVKSNMPLTEEEVQKAIKDANRYTIVLSDDAYTRGIESSLDMFERSFDLVEMDNSWEQGDAYSGVHAIFRDPDGSQFEVQWHTPASVAIKDLIHKDYEEFRVSNDPIRQRYLYDKMARQWDTAPAPGGWPPLTLNTFGGRAELIFRGPPKLPSEGIDVRGLRTDVTNPGLWTNQEVARTEGIQLNSTLDRVAQRTNTHPQTVKDFSSDWRWSSTEGSSAVLQALADEVSGGSGVFDGPGRMVSTSAMPDHFVEPRRSIVKEIQESTQRHFQDAGVTELEVFRGDKNSSVDLPNTFREMSDAEFATGSAVVSSAGTDRNPLTSWATTREAAEVYAPMRETGISSVRSTTIPISQVFSSHETGIGEPNEVLVFKAPTPQSETVQLKWNPDQDREVLVQSLEKLPKTAAIGGGNPYHCPAGTGETSGRFTDAMNATCNPQTSQLSVVGLQQRKARMEQLLAGDISAERRARIEEELRLVEAETQRREAPGQPEGEGVSVEPDEVNGLSDEAETAGPDIQASQTNVGVSDKFRASLNSMSDQDLIYGYGYHSEAAQGVIEEILASRGIEDPADHIRSVIKGKIAENSDGDLLDMIEYPDPGMQRGHDEIIKEILYERGVETDKMLQKRADTREAKEEARTDFKEQAPGMSFDELVEAKEAWRNDKEMNEIFKKEIARAVEETIDSPHTMRTPGGNLTGAMPEFNFVEEDAIRKANLKGSPLESVEVTPEMAKTVADGIPLAQPKFAELGEKYGWPEVRVVHHPSADAFVIKPKESQTSRPDFIPFLGVTPSMVDRVINGTPDSNGDVPTLKSADTVGTPQIGRQTVDNSVEGVLRHELAHWFEHRIADETGTELFSQTKTFTSKVPGSLGIVNEISAYASSSHSELLAEAVTVVTADSYDPSAYNPYVGEFLQTVRTWLDDNQ